MGCEEFPPKLKEGAAELNMLPCCGAWLLESEPAPKLIVGAAGAAPKVKEVDAGCGVLLLPPLPNAKDEGAEAVPPAAKGLLNVDDDAPPPAEKSNEAPPPVPKIDPVPAGWLVAG